jgi:hypothetical protein
MIPLTMIVINEFLEGASKVALAERHDPIEALVRNRPYEPFSMGVPSQPVPADRQPPPVGVSELEALLTQLASKDAVLLHQIRERLPLPPIQPSR